MVTNGGRVLCVTALGETSSWRRSVPTRLRPDWLGRHAVPQGYWSPRHQSLNLSPPSEHSDGRLILPMSRPFTFLEINLTPPASRPISPAPQSRIVRTRSLRRTELRTDSWDRPAKAAAACSRLIDQTWPFLLSGGGVNFSRMSPAYLPPRPPPSVRNWPGRFMEAMGVRWSLYPRNPYRPDGARNVRCFVATKEGEEPVWWFGGMDMTPTTASGMQQFHRTCPRCARPVW